jgi:hypothetical protein
MSAKLAKKEIFDKQKREYCVKFCTKKKKKRKKSISFLRNKTKIISFLSFFS